MKTLEEVIAYSKKNPAMKIGFIKHKEIWKVENGKAEKCNQEPYVPLAIYDELGEIPLDMEDNKQC